MKRFLSVMLCLMLIAGLIAVPVEAKNKTKKNKTKTETTFNAKTAKKNINVKYIKTGEGILAIYKNKNNYAVALTASIKYVDVAGNSLLEDSVENPCIGQKKTMAYFFKGPVDDNNNFMNYRDFSGAISVEK